MAGHVRNGSGWRGSRGRRAVWATAALLWCVPWVAMRFTREVNWDLADFAVFGALLFAACGTYDLAASATGNRAYRAASGVALAAAFLLIWVNLAVGIIGDEHHLANGMYIGVLAIALTGALLARFRSEAMARALVGTALAQAAVAVIALAAGWGSTLWLTGFFVALWLTSARLFRRAAREQGLAGAVP